MFEDKETTVQFTNHQHSRVQFGLLPVGVRCLQVMTGSGRPFAMQTRVTLLPSFTVMSEEILEIFGGTVKTKESWTSLPRLLEGSLSDSLTYLVTEAATDSSHRLYSSYYLGF